MFDLSFLDQIAVVLAAILNVGSLAAIVVGGAGLALFAIEAVSEAKRRQACRARVRQARRLY